MTFLKWLGIWKRLGLINFASIRGLRLVSFALFIQIFRKIQFANRFKIIALKKGAIAPNFFDLIMCY